MGQIAAVFSTVGGFIGLSGTTAVIVGGALVGAAVGGLTTAVTGGDIGSGLLFGAVGGAVAGGISGMVAGAGVSAPSAAYTSSLGEGALGGTSLSGASVTAGEGLMTSAEFNAALGLGAESGIGAGMTSASMLEGIGLQVGVSALGQGVASYIQADAQKDALAAQQQTADEQFDNAIELQKLRGEQAMEQLQYSKDTMASADQAAYDARMAELDQRAKEFDQTLSFNREQYDATQQAKEERQALFGSESRRSGAVASNTNTTGVYDQLQTKPVTALTNPLDEVA